MSIPPYPFDPKNISEFRLQGWRLFRDLYEERLAGCILGDVFTIEGNKDLALSYANDGCLETHSDGGCAITLFPNIGFSVNESGLSLQVKQLAINVDSGEVDFNIEYDPNESRMHLASSILDSLTSASYVTNIALWLLKDAIILDYNLTLPGGKYGFYPQLLIWFVDQNYTYADQTYITASGETYWMFLKHNKLTEKIIGGYFAHDHPCFGNANDPLLVQHPFGKINDDEEIIVINPTEEQVKKLKHLSRPKKIGEAKKPFLYFIGEDKPFNIGKEEREYPKIPVTIGIVEDEDLRPLWLKESAKIMKCVIPQPENVKVRNLHEYN